MSITARNGKKKLLSSGMMNIEIDSDPVIEFDVDGLNVTLEVKILPSDSKDETNVTIDAEDDYVSIKHYLKTKMDNTLPSGGMLRPIDFATRGKGEDLYITWYASIKTTVDNVRIAQISYSFYEDI
jgi:hypothetical protein